MNALDLPHLLTIARETAEEAGHIVLRQRNRALKIATKRDGQPVTAADHASEVYIVDTLMKRCPEIKIISEELVSQGRYPDIGEEPFWLIDPLDGTKDYIAGEAEFTINIGLIVKGEPVLGVVFAPSLDEMYEAAAGCGATARLEDRDKATPISARIASAEGMSVVSSRRHGDEEALKNYLNNIPVTQHKRYGSAVKLCHVAAGKADLYPRFGKAMAWDIAAGHAILKFAGGSVTTVDGQPLNYLAEGFGINNFIARGRFCG
jgi:3'(2'), 5'-bisphosphate nucleotidase